MESSTEVAAYGGSGRVEVAGYVVHDRVEVAETMESSDESDGEIDVGYQEFMRQSEQFRKERGQLPFIALFLEETADEPSEVS